MLYIVVKWIIRLTLNSYFRKIAITGHRYIPAKGPVIFVANHPSAFMDPMVVATCIGRSIHFLSAAEFFGTGIKSWFYQKYLNMIPVYRRSILPNETHNNEAIFSKCFELLHQGGAILVFPEGNSVTEKRIRKLKTGVARMAIGAREYSPSKVEVDIIPIGLNYGNPHRFQSELFINIGKPLSISEFSSDASEVVRLTNLVEERLKEIILHVQHESLDSIVKKVELILKSNFQNENKSASKKNEEFIFQQNVIKSIQTLSEHQPQLLADLELKLDDYLRRIRNLGISDGSIAELSIFVSTKELLQLILTFPLFLVGMIFNIIPYYTTIFYFRKLNLFSREGIEVPHKKVNQAFKGSVAMSIGIVFFIAWYLILGITGFWITDIVWVGILLVIIFYLSGLFSMRYIRWFLLFKQKLKLRKLLQRNQQSFTSLIIERQKIIEAITALIK
ncbi:MAG: 1-acyl-sn-glycerol-3-phosphate acyltransferase [Bacteroidia bacterium]|nr:1-acyl-sn-glycerol-3-phosphate acyltransferase [Bacteroidia bacterium]